MEVEKFLDILGKYRKGTFVRIAYTSDMPVKAAYSGVSVKKLTITTSRFGVRYGHIAGVVPTGKKDYATRINDSLYINDKSSELYLQLAPFKRNTTTNSRVSYLIDGQPASLDKIRDLVIPSYFSRSGEKPPVIRVKLKNVISITNESIGGESYEVM